MKHRVYTLLRMMALLLAMLLVLPMAVSCDEDKNNGEGASTGEQTTQRTEATEAPTETETEAETEPPAEPLKLRFGSYNIKHGADNLDMTKIAKNITDRDLDIVGFQEVDQKTNRVNGMDTMKTLSEKTGYKYYAFFKAINHGGGEYGVGVLSKYPITATEKVMLESAGYEQRVLGRTEIDVDGLKVNFFVTHLSYENAAIRKTQYEQINSELIKYDNFVLTGDFNTSNFDEYAAIENSATVNNHQNSVVTFPSKSSSIDNIVYSTEAWSFGMPFTVQTSYSDHYMLYANGTYIKE